MKKIFLVFISSGLLFVAIYAFLIPFSRISFVELKVSENLKTTKSYRIKEKEILSYLDDYKGRFLWQVSLEELVKTIGTLYLGAEVYVTRRFPNRLKVFLKQKDTALLLLKDGEFFYSISYEGEIGAKKSSEESLDFPVLRGNVFWDDIHLRKRALFILSSVPKEGPVFSVKNISEISYNKGNNSLFFYLISGHFILELTKPPSQKHKKNINFVLNYLNQRGDQGGLIDARLSEKIIVKNLN